MKISGTIPFQFTASDERYRAIVENSVHAFFLSMTDGTIIEASPAATKIFGYSNQEFKKIKRGNIIDETDPVLVMAIQSREKEGWVTSEATGIKKNGERFPIEFSSAIFTDSDGELKASTLLTDISERKQARRELEESENRYKMFLKQSTEGIWRVDLPAPMPVNTPLEEIIAACYESAFIAECNDTFALLNGCNNAAEMIGQPLRNLMPKKNPANVEYLTRFFANGFKVTEQISYEPRGEGNDLIYLNNIVGIVEGNFIRSAWGIQRDITLQKKAEMELLKAKERNDLIAQATNDAIWDWDVSTNMIWGNEIYNKLFNVTTYESFMETLHPDDRKRIVGNFSEAISRKAATITEEFRCKTIDGSYRDFYDRAFMLYDSEGEVYRMSGAMMDITESKKTQQALAESENRLRTIVNSEPECIKLVNSECELMEMNPAGLALLEAENVEELLGKNVASLLLPAYQESFVNLVNNVFEGKTGKLQYEIMGMKGTKRFLDTHAVPLRNTEGKVIALLAITRDITENKNAEVKLLASEERYRYLFNNNPASIVIWDMETLRIIEVNESAAEIYEYKRDEFLELTVLDIRPKDEHDKFLHLVEQARANQFNKQTMTWRHITSKGAIIIMEISSHHIIYNGRKAVLALGKDVTEKVLLENSLAEERQIRQKQITDAVITGQEKERSQLGEELHDNINQILATTRLYIECALSETNPRPDLVKESKLLLEKAMFEIRKLSKTLLPPSLGEIGLLDALNELIGNITEANQLHVEKKWNDFPETLLNEKLRLTIFRIVQEQMNNISKHAKASQVVIELKQINDEVHLNIKDDGIGFNTDMKRGGLGLRNMISRAEVHNGTVNINSTPGAGCELQVVFSLKKNNTQ